MALLFTPDGNAAITGSLDGQVCVWDTRTCNADPIFKLSEHAAAVSACAIEFSARLLATSSLDGTARVWDLRNTGTTLAMLNQHEAEVKFL